MQKSGGSVPVFLLVVIVLAGFGLLLWINSRPMPAVTVLLPTQITPTEDGNAWESVLREGFGSNSTPLPTVAIPTAAFVPPTIALDPNVNLSPIAPGQIEVVGESTIIPLAATPTRPQRPTPLATELPVTAESVTRPPSDWAPPPLQPPLSRDPFGRDHYWFMRPVDSNGSNYGLSYYPYGSDGGDEYRLRVHHGIDMSNPIGQPVRAAGSGTVIWAADGLRTEGSVFENSPSYGNVIVIEHDFGYRGQPLYTIYAHLSAALVLRDQYVEAGEVIGLVGNTGRTTGPHLHFEVRLGENRYAATYNPILWMVPYVGHGVIAGRVTDANGELVDDAPITIRNWATGLVVDTTTTYIFLETGYDVNSDPLWQENFAVADIPVGRYEVIANINGERMVQLLDVLEGTTSFVDLTLAEPAADTQSVVSEP